MIPQVPKIFISKCAKSYCIKTFLENNTFVNRLAIDLMFFR